MVCKTTPWTYSKTRIPVRWFIEVLVHLHSSRLCLLLLLLVVVVRLALLSLLTLVPLALVLYNIEPLFSLCMIIQAARGNTPSSRKQLPVTRRWTHSKTRVPDVRVGRRCYLAGPDGQTDRQTRRTDKHERRKHRCQWWSKTRRNNDIPWNLQ